MQIVGIQVDTVWEDKAATFARVRRLLERMQIQQGAMVVLPEMFAVGFSLDVPKIAADNGRETEGFLRELAARHNVFMLGGVVTRGRDGKGRNEAVVFDPSGRELARYCKLHPFTFGGETQHYEPGKCVATFQWGQSIVAPLICYDLRFPEAFRATIKLGVQVYAVIANWPKPREEHWLTLLRARAIENQAYVIGVNRCGRDPKLEYGGRSQIIDPQGRIIADAGQEEAVLSAQVDLAALAEYRVRFPALADMRDDGL